MRGALLFRMRLCSLLLIILGSKNASCTVFIKDSIGNHPWFIPRGGGGSNDIPSREEESTKEKKSKGASKQLGPKTKLVLSRRQEEDGAAIPADSSSEENSGIEGLKLRHSDFQSKLQEMILNNRLRETTQGNSSRQRPKTPEVATTSLVEMESFGKSVMETAKSSEPKRQLWIMALLMGIAHQFCIPGKKPMTYQAVFALSLIGSSIGFYRFLYFITVGYALALALPAALALIAFNTLSAQPIPILTNLHTGLVLLWALRIGTFLLHREYIAWPQLHNKIIEMNQRAKFQSKFSLWMSCSFFTSFLFMPCLIRMNATANKQKQRWGKFGKLGLGLQGIGLLLESLADYQKSYFKSIPGNANRWCNVGLWRYSTHPNYLGEALFWIGTYTAGLGCHSKLVRHTLVTTFGLVGILVVVRAATELSDAQHDKTYASNEQYIRFKKTHGLLGRFS